MEELKEYLKKIYPKATNKRLDYYISLIERNESESLPLTKEMKDYVKAKNKAKEWEERKEISRSKCIEQKERLNHDFQGLNIKKVETKSFNPTIFYDWVSSLVDKNLLEELTIKTIDEKKFFKLEAKEVIRYTEIPNECFTPRFQWRITDDHRS